MCPDIKNVHCILLQWLQSQLVWQVSFSIKCSNSICKLQYFIMFSNSFFYYSSMFIALCMYVRACVHAHEDNKHIYLQCSPPCQVCLAETECLTQGHWASLHASERSKILLFLDHYLNQYTRPNNDNRNSLELIMKILKM